MQNYRERWKRDVSRKSKLIDIKVPKNTESNISRNRYRK